MPSGAGSFGGAFGWPRGSVLFWPWGGTSTPDGGFGLGFRNLASDFPQTQSMCPRQIENSGSSLTEFHSTTMISSYGDLNVKI